MAVKANLESPLVNELSSVELTLTKIAARLTSVKDVGYSDAFDTKKEAIEGTFGQLLQAPEPIDVTYRSLVPCSARLGALEPV